MYQYTRRQWWFSVSVIAMPAGGIMEVSQSGNKQRAMVNSIARYAAGLRGGEGAPAKKTRKTPICTIKQYRPGYSSDLGSESFPAPWCALICTGALAALTG